MATSKMTTENEGRDVTSFSLTGDNVFRPAWPGRSKDEPDADMLVRVMRFLDDDLDPQERRAMEQELETNSQLRSVLADMEHGTDMAHRAYAAWNAADVSTSRIATLQLPKRKSSAWPSSTYRQAAAIAIGLGIGLLGSRLATMPHDAPSADLHLAGLATTASPQEAQQRALETALVPLLTGTAGASQQVAVNDAAAGMHGYLTVQRHLTLSSGVPCTEFIFNSDNKAVPNISGLACQQADGGWQTLTVDLAR